MLRSGQIPPDLRHPQTQVDQGEVHPFRQRRRQVLPAQALPRAIFRQELRAQL